MGLTKITNTQLKRWRDCYAGSISDQENETKHCTLFYRDLKEFVDYIEKRNQLDKEKKIGCVRFYFVRPEREFQSGSTPMKFVYNPLSVKKANSKGESYPQMRIAMVPMTGERPNPDDPEFDPDNPKLATLKIYSENNDDEFMCLYPGTALRKNHIAEDIEIREKTRKLNKMTRKIKELTPGKEDMALRIKQIEVEVDKDLEHESSTLKQILEEQDMIENGVKLVNLTLEPNHRGEHGGLCPPACD